MTTPLRIAHLNTNGDWGGGENQVLRLVQGLTARGVDNRLFAKAEGALWTRAAAAGVALEPVPGFPAAWRLGRRLSRAGVTLIHAHDSRAAALGGVVGRRMGIPVVLSRRVASPLRNNVWSRRKYAPRRLAAVIAISRTVGDVFAASGYPSDRIYLAPSGLDLEALDHVSPDPIFRAGFRRPFLVGGVGKLSTKKNWSLLIRVAARLAADGGPDVDWVLVGDGPERTRLEALAADLGVADRVHFLGFREDALTVLKTLDLLFFTSLMEGASVTVREAMALGVPVVAVDAPGTMESLDGNGWGVRANDLEGAAAVIRRVLSDRTERITMADRAVRSARQRFSLERTVSDTLAAYENVLRQWVRDGGVA